MSQALGPLRRTGNEQCRCVERQRREPLFFTRQFLIGHCDITIVLAREDIGTVRSFAESKGQRLRGHHVELDGAECGCQEQCCSDCHASCHQGVMMVRCRPLQGMRWPRRSAVNERADPLTGMLCVAWKRRGWLVVHCDMWRETYDIDCGKLLRRPCRNARECMT